MTHDVPAGRPEDLVSVVVCARNRAAAIVDALESIVANRPHEIIVVDDQSTDGTGDVARRYTPHVVRSQGRGLAAARQLGAETARCRYVSFVDSDVVLTEGCLDALVNAIERDDTIAAVSAMTLPAGPHTYWPTVGKDVRAIVSPKNPGLIDSIGMRACLIRRDVLLETGFDPFFVGAGEDMDLSRRLVASGWKLVRVDSVVYHHHPLTLWQLFRQRVWYGRGVERLAIKREALDPSRRGTSRIPRGGRDLLWSFLRERRFAMAVYLVVTTGGFRVGQWLERVALRKTSYPDRTTRASFP